MDVRKMADNVFGLEKGSSTIAEDVASGSMNRRGFATSLGAAALLSAARAVFPSGAFAQGAGPETTSIKLGYIALTDASPLIIAKEKGYFAKHGLPNVEVLKQASWGALRDNLVVGSAGNGIDGAHILTPFPYQLTTGKVTQGNTPVPMYLLSRLNLQCQGISVAQEYKDLGVGLDSSGLKVAFARKKSEGKELKAAMTFPGGTHDLWIRYWLAAGGIDPDKDVQVLVIPPPQMVANMKVNNMDLFCVGEPWNEQLVNQGIGFTACSTGEIWKNHPEKSLSVRADFVDKNPIAAKALLMATIEAQQWCEQADNKAEMAEIVGRRQWFYVPTADIIGRIKGDINYGNGRQVSNPDLRMRFFGDGAAFPYPSHDAWFLAENIRWGKFAPETDIKALVGKVNRADLWREAAKAVGVPSAQIPAGDSRGKETFFDGKVFDPADPSAYLASLNIKRSA